MCLTSVLNNSIKSTSSLVYYLWWILLDYWNLFVGGKGYSIKYQSSSSYKIMTFAQLNWKSLKSFSFNLYFCFNLNTVNVFNEFWEFVALFVLCWKQVYNKTAMDCKKNFQNRLLQHCREMGDDTWKKCCSLILIRSC